MAGAGAGHECIVCGCVTDQECVHQDGGTIEHMHYLCGVWGIIEDALKKRNSIKVTMQYRKTNQDSLDFVLFMLNRLFEDGVHVEEMEWTDVRKRPDEGWIGRRKGATVQRDIVFKFTRSGLLTKSAVKRE